MDPERWQLSIERVARPRRSGPRWHFTLALDGQRVFDSRWVTLKLNTERGARWVARLVRTAIEAGVFAPPRGANVRPSHRAPILWTQQGAKDWDDDSVCTYGGYGAHVEWLFGPQGKGGEYYVGVWSPAPKPGAFADFHYTEVLDDMHIRSGDAGRFLAELLIDLASAGQPIPAISDLPQA